MIEIPYTLTVDERAKILVRLREKQREKDLTLPPLTHDEALRDIAAAALLPRWTPLG